MPAGSLWLRWHETLQRDWRELMVYVSIYLVLGGLFWLAGCDWWWYWPLRMFWKALLREAQ